MYCVVHVFRLYAFWFSFREYGDISLYEPKYFGFKILGWGLEVLCGLCEVMVGELVP